MKKLSLEEKVDEAIQEQDVMSLRNSMQEIINEDKPTGGLYIDECLSNKEIEIFRKEWCKINGIKFVL